MLIIIVRHIIDVSLISLIVFIPVCHASSLF
jgi:hypothetical protein